MQTAMEQTYEDVEMLIHSVTLRFLRNKRIGEREYDEWHGEACRAFCSSWHSFDSSRARFTTHLWHGVWHALVDKMCREASHYRTLHHECENKEELMRNVIDESSPDHPSFVMSLSEDANTVVRLVLGAGGCWEREPDPGEIRVGICEMLMQSFGWSFHRVVEAFHEVKTCLLD